MTLFRPATLTIALFCFGLLAPWTGAQAAETTAPTAQSAPAAASTQGAEGAKATKPAGKAAPAAKPAPQQLPKVPLPKFPHEQAKLAQWKESLDGVDEVLKAHNLPDEVLDNLRTHAAAVQNAVGDFISAATPHLKAAQERLKQLEPAPGSAPQSNAVLLQRAKLQAEVTARQDIVQQAQLTNVRAQQAMDTISDRRRARFTDSVLRRSRSLINPGFWIAVISAVPTAASNFSGTMGDWAQVLAAKPAQAVASVLFMVMLLVGYFFSPVRQWVTRWTTRDPTITDPGTLRRSRSAIAITLAHTAIPGISLLVLYQAMTVLGVLPDEVAAPVAAFCIGLTFIFFFAGLMTAVLAPGRPAWRIIAVADAAADSIVPVAVLIALVAAAGHVMHVMNQAIETPLELAIAEQGVVGVVMALLFMMALRMTARGAPDDDDDTSTAPRSAWRLLVPLGWVLAIAAVVAPIVGYVTFSRYITTEMLVMVTILTCLVLLSQFADALITLSFSTKHRVGHFMRHTVGFSAGAVRQMGVVLSGVTQLALLGLALFLLLATWGIQSSDLLGQISGAFFGIKIGNFTLSLSALLGGLVVFGVGILATRAVQRWLEGKLLPQTNLDIGLRTSIRTGVGYAGAVLAAIIGFSVAGLNLQNLAIVAGALSVGIGFGLQSVVNNFVSGLILLVERPFKVGDRIEIGDKTGIVKRINVRSTEVMTFDNASIIVPNADLITGQVINWMHGDFSGRLTVSVGVSYNADPDQMIAILLDIVNSHPQVLKRPEPFAILAEFGADSLNFTVYFYVGNIGTEFGVGNEVRLTVLKRLREADIEIPFAQRDIHLRDLDRIEALVRSVAGKPAKTAKTAKVEASAPKPSDESSAKKAGEGGEKQG